MLEIEDNYKNNVFKSKSGNVLETKDKTIIENAEKGNNKNNDNQT
jgi:hypothetical protein